MFLSCINYIACRGIPLLLTVKLLNFIKRGEKLKDAAVFLLNYWLDFAVVGMIEPLIIRIPLHKNIVRWAMMSLQMWLFYGHGCLVVNKVYGRMFAREIFQLRRGTFEEFEVKYIHSLGKWLQLSKTGSIVKSTLNLLPNIPFIILNFKKPLERASHLYEKSDQDILKVSLNNICYIDSSDRLELRRKAFEEKMSRLTGYLSGVHAIPRNIFFRDHFTKDNV